MFANTTMSEYLAFMKTSRELLSDMLKKCGCELGVLELVKLDEAERITLEGGNWYRFEGRAAHGTENAIRFHKDFCGALGDTSRDDVEEFIQELADDIVLMLKGGVLRRDVE